ncbi:hypothetical protein V5T82_09750 [Magnetovibrio sp. PR-2]|uniref:hypothetical protein n=1 Tax=Magnetovibrio sp. PR-2 TaxID=3120356 RepID=UPI002FCE2F9D
MENPYWHPEEKSHIVNTDDVRLLAFDMFNIVRTSMGMVGGDLEAEDKEGDVTTQSEDLHYHYAEAQLSKNLLQFSILMRTLDDYWSDYGHEDYIDKIGKLNADYDFGMLNSDTKSDVLSFREAFNKIIHARDIRPVYSSEHDRNDPEARWGMDGQIELQGEYHGKNWDVLIHIFDLLDGTLELIDFVDELNS